MTLPARGLASTPLSELTTIRVGGPAERMFIASSAEELVAIARDLWREDEPWYLLGGGSNTVFADAGFDGTVVVVRGEGIEFLGDAEAVDLGAGSVRLRVQAGYDWDALVEQCVSRGWSGIEALSGIPGQVGAAPVQNIGAYGQELSDVLHAISFYDRELDEVVHVPASELELDYRSSSIKSGREGIVLAIELDLQANEGSANPLSTPIAYGQLADALGVNVGDRVSVRELRRAVLRLRASKGMVLDNADHDTWSAGSFFTNPIVTERFARSLPAAAPRYPLPGVEPAAAVTTLEELDRGAALRVPDAPAPRLVKLSAAWLIEHSGVKRGFSLPGSGAAISSKHTLAITNRGAASAANVAELARYVLGRVSNEFGINLVPEPNLVGLDV